MKLTVRFADQIVGAFIILALGAIVFVIFMLGSSQRWFSRDYSYRTYFTSANGLNQNLAVQYKGFTIGHVKSIELTEDDRVEVIFTIFDTYIDRVKTGSLVELVVSPIGGLGGNQLLFYPGAGTEQIPEGEIIYSVNSSEGKRMMAMGLAVRPEHDDSLSNIINRAGNLLGTLDDLARDIQEAFEGTDRTSLGRTLGTVELAAADLQVMAGKLPSDLEETINSIMAMIDPILADFNVISKELSNPDGTLMTVLDSDGEVYTGLASSLESISGMLKSLDETIEFIPAQLPQISMMLVELYSALSTAQDLMVSLTNNPLFKKGVPEHKESKTGGTYTRDADF